MARVWPFVLVLGVSRPVRRGGSLGANEPPFEMSFEKNDKTTTVNELSFYNR